MASIGAPDPTPDMQPFVTAQVTHSGLRVTLSRATPPANMVYAFYLFRDDQRIAQTDYGSSPEAYFPVPNLAGSYRPVAFVRRKSDGQVERLIGPRMNFPDVREYNTARWRLTVRESTSGEALRPEDGIHRFIGSGTSSLDFLLQDFARLAEAPAILVCFNGAVSQRMEKTGPFFAGTGIARRLQLPVICVADPTLTRARDLSLAWYAGCDDHPDLPASIARQLDAVAESRGRPLVLLGGSGGGYASLAVLRHLRSPATAVACNPQTIIHSYYRQSVARFIERAFPLIARRQQIHNPRNQTPEQLRDALSAAGLAEDLTRQPEIGRLKCLLLQNINDTHHVEGHLKPLLDAAGAVWTGPRLASAGAELAAWTGSWGEGHVSPPAALLEPVVTRIASGESPHAIALDLERRYGELLPPAQQASQAQAP